MSLPIRIGPTAYLRLPTASYSLLGLLALAVATVIPCRAHAQDAKTILRDMLNTYRGMTSYRARATVDRRQGITGGKVLGHESFTSTFLYRKPNKLKLDFAMPSGGLSVYYDGSKLTSYKNSTQSYTTTPVVAADLAQLEVPLMHVQVASKFDPLYFLSGKELPSTVTGIKRAADQTRDGRPCYVVTGRQIDKASKFPMDWTWFIDKKTHLLTRIQGRISNVRRRASFVEGKKRVIKDVLLEETLTENIIDPVANPKLDDGAFVFVPPAGARPLDLMPPNSVGKGQ